MFLSWPGVSCAGKELDWREQEKKGKGSEQPRGEGEEGVAGGVQKFDDREKSDGQQQTDGQEKLDDREKIDGQEKLDEPGKADGLVQPGGQPETQGGADDSYETLMQFQGGGFRLAYRKDRKLSLAFCRMFRGGRGEDTVVDGVFAKPAVMLFFLVSVSPGTLSSSSWRRAGNVRSFLCRGCRTRQWVLA